MMMMMMIISTPGLYAEILQGGGELGVFKKEGGAAASSARGSTGRQCLKISLVILRGRGGEIDTREGGECPPPPKYTPAPHYNIINRIDTVNTVFPRIVSAESILFRSCQLRLLNEGGY